MMPFGSIGTAASRWFTIRCETTTSASSKMPSTGPVPIVFATFDPCSSWMIGASASSAASMSATAGSGSYSTITASAASNACDFDRATTIATMSPTNRTRSRASGGRFIVGGSITKP